MAVFSTFGWECPACGTSDEGWDSYAGARDAEIAHLRRCTHPGAAEHLEEVATP